MAASEGMTFPDIEPSNSYRPLLFRRGFLASTRALPAAIDPRWARWTHPAVSLAYDPDVPFVARANGDSLLAILGVIVSVEEETDAIPIQDKLFRTLLKSEDHFLAALDHCSGRFVCFFTTGASLKVASDALGMRMVYYTTEPDVAVASHVALLADAFGLARSERAARFLSEAGPARRLMAFLPGHATTFEGARILPPNTLLDVRERAIRRFYPREPLPPQPAEQAAARAALLMARLFRKFAALSPVAVSFTAGLDSRLTAAAAKGVEGVAYFTYLRRGVAVNEVDAAIAGRLARRHGLRHQIIPFDDQPAGEDFAQFRAVAEGGVEFEHVFSLAHAYLASFPPGFLHMRSNAGEICRARYHVDPFPRFLPDGMTLLEQFSTIYCIWVRLKPRQDDFIDQEFSRYVRETELESETHGYDLRTLYYWEHLMGTWHASLLLESDLSHDTVSLFNCRAILEQFLSTAFEEQTSKRVMMDAIRTLHPSFLDEPINPPVADLPADELEMVRRGEGDAGR